MIYQFMLYVEFNNRNIFLINHFKLQTCTEPNPTAYGCNQ